MVTGRDDFPDYVHRWILSLILATKVATIAR